MEREDPTRLIQEVLAEAWSRTALQDALQQIAEGVTEVAGFGVAAVSVLRETNEFEVVAVIAAVVIANMISADGESNWLEGVQLIALYAMMAGVFFLIR